MGGPVRVNGREVVTSKSEGVSFASGDVCIVPGAGPVPFVNVAVSADATNAARTVRVHGVAVVLAGSQFSRSTGDEAGTDGGLLSRTTKGAAEFANYSYDVRFEGQNVPRALDPMLHNLDGAGVPNAFSPAELQPLGAVDPELDVVCEAICYCAEAEMRMDCFRRLLATPIQSWIPTCTIDPDAPPGHKSCVRYWDPHVPPGFYVEPAYRMTPPPPVPMLGAARSETMRDAAGEPLPLPGGDSPVIPGSRRPDVVVPLDPTKPPGPGNIKRIFEVKFPGDRRRRGQERAYNAIGAPTANVEFVGPDDPCDCHGRHRPKPHELPVPIDVPDPKRRDEPESPRSPMEPEPNVPAPMEFPNAGDVALGVLAVLLGIVVAAKGGAPGEPTPIEVPAGGEPVPAPAGGAPVWPWTRPPQEA